MPRGVLFVHNNFPGQFRDLAGTLIARGVPCCAVGQGHSPGLEGVRLVRYNLPRGTGQDVFPLAVRAEADLIRGRTAYDAALHLKTEGWDPAVIVGHPGWGEMVFMAEMFPDARQVAFAEFFYHARGYDVDFDSEFVPPGPDYLFRTKAKNAVMALSYGDADAIVAPTRFQADTLPRAFRDHALIIHEGVDVDRIRPGTAEPFLLDDGRVIAPGTPLITHINNAMEPLRGLHILARALPRLLAEVPDAQVMLIGTAGRRAYGGNAPEGQTWRDICFQGVDYDPVRVHFMGELPHDRMLAALRLGVAHVYYTYPFVLSWSLVEAMASGCYVVASDTPPLHDAIEDGVNGRLLPFFDVAALSETLIGACRNPDAAQPLRAAARATAVEKFSSVAGQAAWLALLGELGVEFSAA